MDILFITILLLSPLPGCFVLYRYLNAKNIKLMGRFFEFIKLKISGVILFYIVILFIETLFLYPAILKLDFDNVRERWHYDVVITSPHTFDNKGQPVVQSILKKEGYFKIRKHSGNLIYVNNVSKNVIDSTPKIGLQNNHLLYFSLPTSLFHPDHTEIPPLIALGSYHPAKMSLAIQPIFTPNTKQIERWHGKMTLTRIWPFTTLLMATLIPIAVILLLGKIGLLLGKFNLFLNQSSGKSKRSLQFEVHGAIITYIMMLILVLIFSNNGVPELTCKNRDIAENYCQKFAGKKFFSAHAHLRERADAPFNKLGQFTMYCGNKITQASLHGFTLQYDGQDDDSHYIRANWKTIITGFDKDTLYGIYDFGSTHNRVGLLTGSLQKLNGKYHLYYYDFIKPHKHTSFKPEIGHVVIYDNPSLITDKRLIDARNQGNES